MTNEKRNPQNERPVELVLNDPATWAVSNLDLVAETVRDNPFVEYAQVFWNTYQGPFSDIPCNEPLRSVIIRAKRSHPTYASIPDEEYLGDVMALMGTKMLVAHEGMPDHEIRDADLRGSGRLREMSGCQDRPGDQ